mgnify:CR=1 FL=1
MFWIMGADSLARKLLATFPFEGTDKLSQQFEHVEWEGFRFYDLIFPLFLMLVGCSIPLSLDKLQGDRGKQFARILRRTLFLVLLGLLYNGIQKLDFDGLRWMGVLQRIGICYGIGAILSVFFGTRGLLVIGVSILLAYWGILVFVPVPGGVAGDLSPAGNLAGYIDRTFLPGKILPKYYGFGEIGRAHV